MNINYLLYNISMKGVFRMSIFLTSDTHFESDKTLIRENRPFRNSNTFANYVLNLWNHQVSKDDIIYHLGDFLNYNQNDRSNWQKALKRVPQINCKVILIIGNNEERVIREFFNNNFEEFKKYCKKIGFYDVEKEAYIEIKNKKFYLNHFPINHKDNFINLFGHVHRTTGLCKPFGINVGCDLNHFLLYDEDEIFRILENKELYWDSDENCLS